MSSIKENFKNGFAVDKLIYPSRTLYALSWIMLIVGVIVGAVAALSMNIIVMAVALMLLFFTVAIEDIYARNYILRNIKKE